MREHLILRPAVYSCQLCFAFQTCTLLPSGPEYLVKQSRTSTFARSQVVWEEDLTKPPGVDRVDSPARMVSGWRTRFSAQLTASVRKRSSARIFWEKVQDSGSTEASLRRTIRSPTPGVMIVNLSALLMADGMNNARNLQKSRCSVPVATNERGYEIRALQSPLMTYPAFGGSVVAARNGTPGHASISVTIHHTTGAKPTKKRAIEPRSCQAGVKTVTKPS